MLPSADVNAWLHEHIPYRIVAAICMSEIEQVWEPGGLVIAPAGLKALGLNYAALQGRRAAIRWLIDFIGIKMARSTGLPTVSQAGAASDPTDCGVHQFPGGKNHPIDTSNADAVFLANIWRGCSQAIMHPTRNTNHFDVEHSNLNKAAGIIVRFLQDTVYAHMGLKLKDVILEYCRARFPNDGRTTDSS